MLLDLLGLLDLTLALVLALATAEGCFRCLLLRLALGRAGLPGNFLGCRLLDLQGHVRKGNICMQVYQEDHETS